MFKEFHKAFHDSNNQKNKRKKMSTSFPHFNSLTKIYCNNTKTNKNNALELLNYFIKIKQVSTNLGYYILIICLKI